MKSGNRDKAEGALKETKGKIKKGVGKATNDREMEDEGRADELKGKAQNKVGDVKKVFNH